MAESMIVLKFEYYRSDYTHVENRLFLDRVYYISEKIRILKKKKKTKEYNPETGRLSKELILLIPEETKFVQMHEEFIMPEGKLIKIHLIYPELMRMCTIIVSSDMPYPMVGCKHLEKTDFEVDGGEDVEVDEIDALDLLRLPIELAP